VSAAALNRSPCYTNLSLRLVLILLIVPFLVFVLFFLLICRRRCRSHGRRRGVGLWSRLRRRWRRRGPWLRRRRKWLWILLNSRRRNGLCRWRRRRRVRLHCRWLHLLRRSRPRCRRRVLFLDRVWVGPLNGLRHRFGGRWRILLLLCRRHDRPFNGLRHRQAAYRPGVPASQPAGSSPAASAAHSAGPEAERQQPVPAAA